MLMAVNHPNNNDLVVADFYKARFSITMTMLPDEIRRFLLGA